MAATKEDQAAAKKASIRDYYKKPFSPNVTSAAAQKPELRIANALEYIAAQLGMIRETLENKK